MKTRSRQGGVTWIETCVVLAIVGGAGSAAVPAMGSLLDARRLEAAATQVVTDVHHARMEAVARNQPVRISLFSHAQGTCYVVHTGNAGSCACSAAGVASCTGDAREIKTVALAAAQGVAIVANTASMAFDPLHGTATPSATLRVQGRHGRAIHQIVNVMGRVRSCTPGGVPGIAQC